MEEAGEGLGGSEGRHFLTGRKAKSGDTELLYVFGLGEVEGCRRDGSLLRLLLIMKLEMCPVRA
jgi:hypothetical protein